MGTCFSSSTQRAIPLRGVEFYPNAELCGETWITPTAIHDGAGHDLYYCFKEPLTIKPGECKRVESGFIMKLPRGFYASIVSRSGLACIRGVEVRGGPATIDPDFVGPLSCFIENRGKKAITFKHRDRYAQMLIHQRIRIKEPRIVWNKLPENTKRGSGGYGSTGR